ncbi:hypothetical protein BO71DRAFT_37909 [Aspergillus ellipticus CBS 707.79]|uniref:Uncharacterized protein n=1 Tax=Aspergillus ellipticus CBS 707.79 TaxID=1448320 RepID=A0A319D326_9EURO|nr:hypothetical protein BO71DRAFT_37909 [Aspergillus ellipticus CBS 707.79]
MPDGQWAGPPDISGAEMFSAGFCRPFDFLEEDDEIYIADGAGAGAGAGAGVEEALAEVLAALKHPSRLGAGRLVTAAPFTERGSSTSAELLSARGETTEAAALTPSARLPVLVWIVNPEILLAHVCSSISPPPPPPVSPSPLLHACKLQIGNLVSPLPSRQVRPICLVPLASSAHGCRDGVAPR